MVDIVDTEGQRTHVVDIVDTAADRQTDRQTVRQTDSERDEELT